ncbi:MAG: S-layer homology domain-containing protein [Clostridia bacterium]|nr:S-layer homology domain-containing protein [Clostridia bacterium]
MKTFKTISLVLIMLLVGSILSGCIANVSELKINSDGSGSCMLYAGMSEKAYSLYEELAAEEVVEVNYDGMMQFTYEGKKYVGHTTPFNFDNIEELNETLSQHGNATNVDMGQISFSKSEDGKLTFTLSTNADTGNTQSLEEESQSYTADLDEETQKEVEEMLKSIVMILDIEFPEKVEQIAGVKPDGITIKDKKLVIDFLKLAMSLDGKSETFAFVSSIPNMIDKSVKQITFTDVEEKDWYYNQIMDMANKGLLNGKGNNLFCPDDTMTKAEFVTVAAKILYDDKITLNLLNGDVNIWWDKYYRACINNAVFSEEKLKYDTMSEGMQRQEMALVAYGLLKDSGSIDEINTYEISKKIPDFEMVNEQFKEAVACCYNLGILCGTDEKGSFNPDGTLTRAAASTVIYRIMNPDTRIIK